MAGRLMGIEYFRFLQILLAILGLVFCLTTKYLFWVLVVIYVVAVIYELMIVICTLASRSQLGHVTQAIVEVVIGVTILVYTIYVTATAEKDGWLITTIVIGFILPALLFITAYDKT